MAAVTTLTSTAFAQKGDFGGGGFGPPVALPTGGTKEPFKIKITSSSEQPVPTQTPLGVIVNGMSISVEGTSGSGPVYGFVVEVRGFTDAVESVTLLNGEEPWGSPKTLRYGNPVTVGQEFHVHKGKGWDFSIVLRMRDAISRFAHIPQNPTVSVVVTAVLTDGLLEGALAPSPQHSINLTLKVGRVKVTQLKNIIEQNILPYMSHQWLLAVELKNDAVGSQGLPSLVVDLYGSGGDLSDAQVVMQDDTGVQLGTTGVQNSPEEPGKGTAYIHWPFGLKETERKIVYVGVRLGHSWTRGGTIAAMMVPAKSYSRGDQSFRVPLSPNAPLAGPMMTVKPIAETFEIKQVTFTVPLQAGRNDLVRLSVKATNNLDVVLPGFGTRIGWLPETDSYRNFMWYGFTDTGFSAPLDGLQSDGAFSPDVWSLENYRQFEGFEIPVVRGRRGENQFQSGIHLPPGQTAYFVARADFIPSDVWSVVGTVVADPVTWKTLLFPIRGR